MNWGVVVKKHLLLHGIHVKAFLCRYNGLPSRCFRAPYPQQYVYIKKIRRYNIINDFSSSINEFHFFFRMDLKLCQELQLLTQAIHLQEGEHKIISSNKYNGMKSEGVRKASPDRVALPPPHGSAGELATGGQLLCGRKLRE